LVLSENLENIQRSASGAAAMLKAVTAQIGKSTARTVDLRLDTTSMATIPRVAGSASDTPAREPEAAMPIENTNPSAPKAADLGIALARLKSELIRIPKAAVSGSTASNRAA